MNNKTLRITCLIPSATDICVALGLRDSIVGVTHECDRSHLSSDVHVVTADLIGSATLSQGDIHMRVQEQQQQSSVCTIGDDAPPSLYPILTEEFQAANANVIITQDLCAVCAPTSESVQRALRVANDDAESKPKPTIVTLT
jgi:iron complex transport system substrate-binding protein